MRIILRVLVFSAVLSAVIGCGAWSITMATGGEPEFCFEFAQYIAAFTFVAVLVWAVWNAIDDRRQERRME